VDNKNTLQTIFIFGIFVLFFVLLVAMLYPFSTVILWTELLYILIRPLYMKCTARLDRTSRLYEFRRHVCAAAFSLGTLILIIGPLFLLCTLLIQQCVSFLQTAERYIADNPELFAKNELWYKLENLFGSIGIDLPDVDFSDAKQGILSFLSGYSARIFSAGKILVSKTGSFLVAILFVVFGLFFCFLDGPYLGSLMKKAVPISPEYMSVLTRKFSDTTKNLFSGYILVALYQGVVAFLIMLCFRVPGSLLFSVVLMFASFIPIFGASIVWFPIGIVICVTRSVVRGILFLVLCGFCVSFLDNFLRPLFLRDRINVHPLVIFFAILGGLQVFGMNGLILGPLVVILFFTVLDLLVEANDRKNP